MGKDFIETISVSGFKGIRKIKDLELRRMNVLIGANGSGKSNFLGVFELLRALRGERLEDYVARAGGAERLLHFGSKVTQRIEIELKFTANSLRALYHLSFAGPDRLRSGYLRMRAPESVLGSLRVYHFADAGRTSRMRKTAAINDNLELQPEGANLAAVLYLLQERYPASLRQIRVAVQQVAPFFDDFILQPLALNPETILLRWRHRGSDDYFDADSFSDGTLRFIALATLLLLPEQFKPSVILLDEPELGLHPAAVTLLAALLSKAAVDSQVIVSTQSPQLLDHFEPEDVLVLGRVSGGTTVTRLDAERLAGWLEDYSLGQLWEKNEFEGQPVGE
ncbi:MAG: AAA family ATPase [Acidobacteria bacterium]|nr:AAA family ATPase [Acidobacteriota bacterium]